MNPKAQLVQQIESLIQPVLEGQGMELVDLIYLHEFGQWVLRVFVDKTGGITIDDCSNLSHTLGDALDASGLLSQRYSLEVSSPGIERPLKKEKDFQRFAGQKVDVRLFAPLNGRRHFNGVLLGITGDQIRVKDQDEQEYSVPLSQISKAHLDPEIDF